MWGTATERAILGALFCVQGNPPAEYTVEFKARTLLITPFLIMPYLYTVNRELFVDEK